MAEFVGAIDQGTTSTRFMIFDHSGAVVDFDQKEHEQIYPKPGWVEHDASEIWQRTTEVIKGGLDKAGLSPRIWLPSGSQPAGDRGSVGQEHRRAGP